MNKEVNTAVCQPTAVATKVDVNEDLRAVPALEPSLLGFAVVALTAMRLFVRDKQYHFRRGIGYTQEVTCARCNLQTVQEQSVITATKAL